MTLKWRLALTLIVASVAVLLASCAGGSSPEVATKATATATATASATPEPTTDALPSVSDVAPELAYLGDVAKVQSAPTSQTFDQAAGVMVLADGSQLEVSAGSFPGPTEVTSVILDAALSKDSPDGPKGRIYRISTAAEVPLAKPVVLEIAKPGDTVQVLGLEGDTWIEEPVASGPTTRIELQHFSATSNWAGDRPASGDPWEASIGIISTHLSDFR
ncbi:MAG: hypothetical protein ACR2NL_13110, partial [Acidimicrobiia bacterium]